MTQCSVVPEPPHVTQTKNENAKNPHQLQLQSTCQEHLRNASQQRQFPGTQWWWWGGGRILLAVFHLVKQGARYPGPCLEWNQTNPIHVRIHCHIVC